MTEHSALINGIQFSWLEQGEGPLVLLLHGFPDTPQGYESIMAALATAGYRAVAPYMRGYHPTGPAPDGDYSVPALGRDVLALLDHFSDQPALVIGHDWGGFAAGAAAVKRPERIRKLVYMCVPHLGHPRFSLAQLRKSWYVLFFQLPAIPERRVARNHYAFIDRLYRAWSPRWNFSAADTAAVKKSLVHPGSLAAALGYYRAMAHSLTGQQRKESAARITVPTLVVCGEVDACVGRDQFSGIEAGFSDQVAVQCLPGVGHFPQREASAQLSALVLEFFDSP